MAWRDIADTEVESDRILSSPTLVSLRDNPIAIAQGDPGAPRIEYPALSPEVQALILGASALHINVPTSGDYTSGGAHSDKGIRLVNVSAGGDDSINTWYYPRQSSTEYRRHITFKNNGAVAVKVVVAADLYVGSDDVVTARLLVNGSAHHQINTTGGTFENPVMRRIQFNPVSVSAGQFVYLDIQGRIGDGSGRDWVDLGGLYAWLELP